MIEVRASRTTVGLLDDLTLNCVVINAVPMPDNYTWVYAENTTLVIESNSSTITISPFKDGIGTYRCEVFTLAGFDESSITIEVEGIRMFIIIIAYCLLIALYTYRCPDLESNLSS